VKSPRIVLLGPQAERPTLGSVVRDLGIDGPVAAITAGWQEWESDLGGMHSQVGDRLLPLSLYARAERVWAADPELRDAHRGMQADLRALQILYGRQLERAGEAWIELLGADGPQRLVGPERAAALEAIQRLDARHLVRIDELRDEFRSRLRPLERDAVHRERAEILHDLERASLVVIEGGHVAVLYNRLDLFDLAGALADKTLIGCAGGGMLLCHRVVLFNDAPAIGRGHAEVGLPGLGLLPGVVALPDAGRRLRLDDAARMRRLALRVAPDRVVLLDPGDRLDWDGVALAGSGSRRVEDDGTLTPWGHAA
jgi:hypothetical protein